MQVKCEMVERRPAKFSVSYDIREKQKTVGAFGWDEDLNEWVADESLLRCLELLASDSNLRQGRLGSDVERAQDIAIQVAGAWVSVASDSSSASTLKIPKLDTSIRGQTVELYPQWAPLENFIQSK